MTNESPTQSQCKKLAQIETIELFYVPVALMVQSFSHLSNDTNNESLTFLMQKRRNSLIYEMKNKISTALYCDTEPLLYVSQ